MRVALAARGLACWVAQGWTAPGYSGPPVREAAMIAIQPCRTLDEIADELHAGGAPLAERVCIAITVAEQIGPDRPDAPGLHLSPWLFWISALAGCGPADVRQAVSAMTLAQRIRARCCTEQDVAAWAGGQS